MPKVLDLEGKPVFYNKVLVRITQDQHTKIRHLSNISGQSVNVLIRRFIRNGIENSDLSLLS